MPGRPIGATRVVGGKLYRKVAERKRPRNWQAEHRRVWESVNGPVPEGHRLHCRDGNWLNLSMDNFFLVSDQERGQMYGNLYPQELIEVITLNNRLKRKLEENGEEQAD